jgi:hypothetical protein
MSEAPIHPLMRDNGDPEWLQIANLFFRNHLASPPIPLRDELSTMLAWARYGEAVATSSPPIDGVGTEDEQFVQCGWAYQDKRWDADRWHVCGFDGKPRECEGRLVRPIYVRAALTVGTEPKTTAWCQPMNCGEHTPRKFIVRFEDADVGDSVFDDEAEARAFYERASTNWNCYLFGSLLLTPPQEPSVQKPVAWLHEIMETDKINPQWMLSLSAENPWSHWMASFRDKCTYVATPLFATPCQTCFEGEEIITWRPPSPKEPQIMVERIIDENEKLRSIISDCAKALGNGAYIAPSCTVEFMSKLPEEIRLVVADLRRAALQHQASLPVEPVAGWALVPKEPTWEMEVAGRDVLCDTLDDDAATYHARDVYRAMLAASPSTEGGK